jgi:hypothetical protein
LLVIPSRNCNCHGQHGHGGVFFTKLKKEATRRQSTEIQIYGLLAIMVLLRLVPRDCWLVVALAQNERYHGWSDAQRFRFCCLMLDWQVRKRFLNDLRARFWRKGAAKLDLEKNREPLFLHEYKKVEGRIWPITLSSTSSMYCAI